MAPPNIVTPSTPWQSTNPRYRSPVRWHDTPIRPHISPPLPSTLPQKKKKEQRYRETQREKCTRPPPTHPIKPTIATLCFLSSPSPILSSPIIRVTYLLLSSPPLLLFSSPPLLLLLLLLILLLLLLLLLLLPSRTRTLSTCPLSFSFSFSFFFFLFQREAY